MSTINPNYDLALWKRFKEDTIVTTCNEINETILLDVQSTNNSILGNYDGSFATIGGFPPTNVFVMTLSFYNSLGATLQENKLIDYLNRTNSTYLKTIWTSVGSPGSSGIDQFDLKAAYLNHNVVGNVLTINFKANSLQIIGCNLGQIIDTVKPGVNGGGTGELIDLQLVFGELEQISTPITNKDIYAVTHIDSQVGTLQYDLGTGTATDGNILLYKFNNTNNKYEPYTPTGTLIPDDINIGLDTVIGLLNTMIGVNGYEIEYTSPTKLNNETDNFYSRQVIVLNTETNTIISTVVEYSTDGHTWTATVPSGTLTIGWVDKPLANKIIELVGVGTAVTTVIPATAKSISIRRKSGNPVVSDGINPPYTLSQANETVSWSNSNMSNTVTVTVTSIIDKVVIVTTE